MDDFLQWESNVDRVELSSKMATRFVSYSLLILIALVRVKMHIGLLFDLTREGTLSHWVSSNQVHGLWEVKNDYKI